MAQEYKPGQIVPPIGPHDPMRLPDPLAVDDASIGMRRIKVKWIFHDPFSIPSSRSG
jgi:hypothetical protein